MRLYRLLLPLLLALLAQADTVQLSTGKTINGTITSFSARSGLVLDSDYGEITIKPGNLLSFTIDTSRTIEAEPTVTYETSQLNSTHKLTFDFDKITADTILFDADYESIKNALVLVKNDTKGSMLFLGHEEVGLDNMEYFKIIRRNIKSIMTFSRVNELKKHEINGIDVITQQVGGEMQGMDLTYSISTFKIGNTNYRLMFWSITSIMEKVAEHYAPFIATLSKQ